MADAAISLAVEKLGNALINKVKFLKGVEEQVRWLIDELQSMRCFLKDAVEKQSNNEYGNLIHKWISDVRVVAQDAEDAIEIFALKVDKPTRKRDLVRKWAGYPAHVAHLDRVGNEIESIRTRLDEIAKRRERYGIQNLGEVGMESSLISRSEMVELRQRMAARFQKDKDVVGLNEDADLLLNKLILDQGREGLTLTAIVGMGGIGKSTLARKIYNHPAIADHFQSRAWVVVSSEFAAEDIIKQIMHELCVFLNHEELKTLESIQGKLRRQEMLQEILRNRLEGKRYFIVLDDVWEHTHWELLKDVFPDEQGKASVLVFTSRNQIMTEHHGYIHKMKFLNSDESLKLLLKTSFVGRSEDKCPRELEEIGREILKKCDGLPLAIKVAGGLLVHQGGSKSGWDRILKQLKNYHSETSKFRTSISAILELSYHNLPSQLKPCFLSLALFKEDDVIRATRLMHIWVQLGLVKVEEAGEESVEEIARSYLDELINRNLILLKSMSIDGRVKYCYVHDLLLELSISKAKEEIGFERLISEGSLSSSYKPRHRVIRGIHEKRLIRENKHLRSLFLHVESPNDAYNITPSYWEGFELLRILDIEGSRFERLPSTIRALIGLRYLRLRENGTLELPSWLDVLKNLEVVDIADCACVKFPDATWKMDSLRHFHIDSPYSFSDAMRKSTWKNLETLKYISPDNFLFDNPTQGFSHLRKMGVELGYSGRMEEMQQLLVKTAVQELHVRWFGSPRYMDLPLLNSLTKLKLNGRMPRCPTADKFPQNITHLTLSGSLLSDPMQELGKLAKLEFLKLDNWVYDVSLKVSHDGFPSLKVFHLKGTYRLKSVDIEEGGMPELQRLEIYECPRFQTGNLRERLKSAEIIISDPKFPL